MTKTTMSSHVAIVTAVDLFSGVIGVALVAKGIECIHMVRRKMLNAHQPNPDPKERTHEQKKGRWKESKRGTGKLRRHFGIEQILDPGPSSRMVGKLGEGGARGGIWRRRGLAPFLSEPCSTLVISHPSRLCGGRRRLPVARPPIFSSRLTQNAACRPVRRAINGRCGTWPALSPVANPRSGPDEPCNTPTHACQRCHPLSPIIDAGA